MKFKTIQNKLNFNNLIEISSNYKNKKPFPYCVIDNLWDFNLLKNAEKEFNEFQDWDGEKKFAGAIKKRFCETESKMPSNIIEILRFCNSSKFIASLEKLTGEKGLIPDPHYRGAGMHSTTKGGFLKMHTDFNWNEDLNLYRRINLLIYLNSKWENNWGGELKFATKNYKGLIIQKSIKPIFNRTVIFTTSDISFHGVPESVNSPENIDRKSLILYYYVAKRPKNTSLVKKTSTNYRLSDGSALIKRSFLKNALSLIKDNLLPRKMLEAYKKFRNYK